MVVQHTAMVGVTEHVRLGVVANVMVVQLTVVANVLE